MSKAWSKDINISINTFGGTDACHILAEMMNNNVIPVYEKHRVLSFIHKSIHIYKKSSQISDYPTKCYVLKLIKNDLINQVKTMPYNEKFLCYLNNVIMYYYRKFLEKVI